MLKTYLEIAAMSYLLGSIPFGYILVRIFRGEDVRASGSGNIGATNVARTAPLLGVVTLLLDAAKGFAAVVLAFQLASRAPDQLWFYRYSAYVEVAAALLAILGHMFPIWLGFKGGKGVATGVGAFFALAPKSILLAIAIFAGVVAISRYVSLGSIVAAAAFPALAYLLYRNIFPLPAVLVMVASSALIILKHHQNIRRLLAGTEHRFELKRTRA